MTVGDVGKVWDQRIQEKWVYMLKQSMLWHTIMNVAASKGLQTGCLHDSAQTLKNYHLILEKGFKMILLGKIPYKGLVLVKNMKPQFLNQNLDNWKWFPNLCQNRGANTAANFQKS